MGDRVSIRPRLAAVSLAAAAVVGVAGGVWWGTRGGDDGVDADLSQQASVGDQLPDVSVVAEDGSTVSTGDLVGTPLVVNLWYSTCAPCRREMPALAAAADEYGGAVRFVGINPLDDADMMRSFADEVGVSYDLYRDPEYAFTDAARPYGFPTTLFVDAEGTIVVQTGEVDADDVRRHVEAIL